MVLKRLKVLMKWPLLRIWPARLLQQLRFELRLSLRSVLNNLKTAKHYRTMEGVRLNVGCGERPASGWVNFDFEPGEQVEFWDCRKGLPFKAGAVTAIFTEHFIEHLEFDGEVQNFIKECLRCLSDSGVLRISVPNAGEYLKLYANDDWDGISKRRPLVKEGNNYRDYWLDEKYSTKMQFINAVFRQGGEHKYAYDAETLIQLLRSIGFKSVNQTDFQKSSDPAMTPDSPKRRFESLYVEARKI